MTVFIVISALMVLLALGAVLWPLLRSAPSSPRPWPAVVMVIVLLPLVAGGVYAWLSNWSWNPAPQTTVTPAAIEQMVAGLEEKMRSRPADVEGWLMLGRSYVQLNRYFKAADAYQQAYTLTQGKNAEAVLGLGEALAFADENNLTTRSAQLFEEAIALAPDHPKALWYSGLAAYKAGNLAQARDRWSRLVALNPPPEVRKVLESKIVQMNAQLGETSAPSAGASATAASIKVRVSISPALKSKVPDGAPLFVLVRAGEGGGPPLAVTRRDSRELPVTIELTDRDAMIAGRSLAQATNVTVVARIARSGEPRAQSGDLEGHVGYDVDKHETVDLLIDSIVQ